MFNCYTLFFDLHSYCMDFTLEQKKQLKESIIRKRTTREPYTDEEQRLIKKLKQEKESREQAQAIIEQEKEEKEEKVEEKEEVKETIDTNEVVKETIVKERVEEVDEESKEDWDGLTRTQYIAREVQWVKDNLSHEQIKELAL